jgi:hypothetical protein
VKYCPDETAHQAYHKAGNALMMMADVFYARLTGFTSLNECLKAQGHGYRPTFREENGMNKPVVFMAEVYDLVAERRGLKMRAYRPEQKKEKWGDEFPGVPSLDEDILGRP